MDLKRLEKHIKLCKKNLNQQKVKCCAFCPFEEEIIKAYPELASKFEEKRNS